MEAKEILEKHFSQLDFVTSVRVDEAALSAMQEVAKLSNNAIRLASESAETTAVYAPNCDDHTPYRGVCGSCGRYDNPDTLIGEK